MCFYWNSLYNRALLSVLSKHDEEISHLFPFDYSLVFCRFRRFNTCERDPLWSKSRHTTWSKTTPPTPWLKIPKTGGVWLLSALWFTTHSMTCPNSDNLQVASWFINRPFSGTQPKKLIKKKTVIAPLKFHYLPIYGNFSTLEPSAPFSELFPKPKI